MTYLKEFVKDPNVNADILKKVSDQTMLMNSQSHIISMNIAHALLLLKKYEEAIIFMKIGLENAIRLQEPDRLGLGLILLARLNHRQNAPWESMILNLLKNKESYSHAVVKEALNVYSRQLFSEHRYYEAEHYINQSESMRGDICPEGLYLPNFDFSY